MQHIQLIPFPTCKVKEAIVINSDGSETIFINCKLNREEILKAYNHALKHIESNDFEKFNVQSIEYLTHNI